METSNDRLRKARIAKGFKSARAAALRYGWTVSTYASHENGQTPVPQKAAEKYAPKFEVTAAYILTGEGGTKAAERRNESGRETVPVMGYVGAGSKIFPFEGGDSGIDEVELPTARDGLNCVIVRGVSQYPRYLDGEKIFYRSERVPPSQLIGRECVIHLTNGQMLIKIIRRGSRKTLFNLESWNAPLMEDQTIDWAAPVLWRG